MKINFIKVPIFYGSDRPGVELGPDTMIQNNIIDIFEKKGNIIKKIFNTNVDKYSEQEKFATSKKLKYYKGILDANKDLANKLYETLKEGILPFVLGGDHSLGIGSIAATSKFHNKDLAVIWIDAHTDINTIETSPSANIHGMPLSISLGEGNTELNNILFNGKKINGNNVYILGARSVDDGEYGILEKHNVNVWYMNDIKEKGIEACIEELLLKLKEKNTKNIHLSYDIDSLDEKLVPGTGTPEKDGMNIEQSKKLIKSIIQTKLVRSIDFVEFNPMKDINDITLKNVIKMLNVFSLELSKL
ncbi:arginase [Helcococcus ovis]